MSSRKGSGVPMESTAARDVQAPSDCKAIDFKAIQDKWQGRWEESGIFHVKEEARKEGKAKEGKEGRGTKGGRKKFYMLEMYPYPSGSGLHMGHARNYTLGDAFARFKRMQGYNVLYPMGYDSFGLPAENAAIKEKTHPRLYTEKAIANFISQQKGLGLSYDWSRMIASHHEEFYRWDQWIFLKLFEKGFAYKKTSIVNWCPACETVLANEQVVDGCCWRHEGVPVENKELNQWFTRITAYADKLLEGLERIDWPEDVKQMQRNWIGKSHGVDIHFVLEGTKTVLPAYTTRSDTTFSVTFLCIAPEHPLARELAKGTPHEKEVAHTIAEINKQSLIERSTETGQDKIGAFTGKYAINPVNNERIPIHVANFVLMYGTGIVMADAHDQRDFEFARKYNIPLKFVISDDGTPIDPAKASRAFLSDGILFGSGEWSGMHNKEALPLMAEWIEKNGWGKRTVNYRLRDWLISRQRYWGCPIPVVYCKKCGIVPVPEKELPVKLPEDVHFGHGNPLATSKAFIATTCPTCQDPARRETDTMDTFMDSSWYFLRYCDPKNVQLPFGKAKVDYWLPIDLYIGGKEHATGHLIYSRFITKFLKDLGMHDIDEPAQRLFNQGMLHKGGVVMSKSKGNVVLPEEVSATHGIDTARFFLVFVAGPDKDMEWSDQGVEGAFRFMKRLAGLMERKMAGKADAKEESCLNRTIKDVTAHYESLAYNKALIEIMRFQDYLAKKESFSKKSAETLLLLLAPITPHVCEEYWEALCNKPFISIASWPKADEKRIDLELEAEDALVEKVREDILALKQLIKFEPKELTLIIAPKWKYNLFKKVKKVLEGTRDMKRIITYSMEKGHERDVAPIVASILKDPSKMPEFVLSQDVELQALKAAGKRIGQEFSAQVHVIAAEESKEAKAVQANPGKPAIVAA